MSDQKPSTEDQNERLVRAFEKMAVLERHKLEEAKKTRVALEACEVALSNIATALNILLPPLKIVDPQKTREQADKVRAGWSGY